MVRLRISEAGERLQCPVAASTVLDELPEFVAAEVRKSACSSLNCKSDEAIMGDEIFPDEVMEIRVQMTKRYQEPSGSTVEACSVRVHGFPPKSE